MPSIEKEPTYDVYYISRGSLSALPEHPFLGCLSGAVGSVDVWCSARRGCPCRGFESLALLYQHLDSYELAARTELGTDAC